MNILLMVHQFFPDHTTGTEVLTFKVAETLSKRGHEVRIITGYPMKQMPEEGKRFDDYDYLGLRVDRYYHHEASPVGEQANIAELEYNNRLFEDWLRRSLSDWRPDLVHFFHLKNLSVSSIDVFREMKIPMVLTPTDFWLICHATQLLLPDDSLCKGPDPNGSNCVRHAVASTQPKSVAKLVELVPDALLAYGIRVSGFRPLAGCPPFSWASALAKRPTFIRQRVRWLDCVVAPTRFMEKMLVENRMSPKKLLYSRFGIDLTMFDGQPVERGTLAVLRVGFIGSLAHHKGVHVLLEAIRRLPSDVPLEVQIFGNPDVYPEYVQQLLEMAKGDQRILFRGTFPNETIGEVLAGIDVFVVPSLWYENTPLVIYSAQAAGCPVIASDLGGMSEVVRDGVDGLLFPVGNSEALAAILERLCGDRNLVRVLSENVSRPKSTSEYVDEMESIYEDLLASRVLPG